MSQSVPSNVSVRLVIATDPGFGLVTVIVPVTWTFSMRSQVAVRWTL